MKEMYLKLQIFETFSMVLTIKPKENLALWKELPEAFKI